MGFEERSGKKKNGLSQPYVTSGLNFPARPNISVCLCMCVRERVLQRNGTIATDRKTSCFPPHFSLFWSSVPHRQ